MTVSKGNIRAFQKKLFTWWETHKRDLPWRKTHDPYRILVSEVMLQQTQVSRVIPKYSTFLKTYPSVHRLARATPSDVLRIWKGMGYNRRALFLHKTAKIISKQYKGTFPVLEQELSLLPGVGKYTSRAVLVFAYKKDIALVDTNIRRIITHAFFDGKKQKESVIEAIAECLVPKRKSWEWHQALMDYGALNPQKRAGERKGEKKQPFRKSNRFFRGKVMDLLRVRPYGKRELIGVMIKKYGKTARFYGIILSSLEKDGLITSNNTTISLPEA